MSQRASILMKLYLRNLVTQEGLRKAVADKTITEEEYNIIIQSK